jgi:polysaccharide export outer membrane protein
MTRIRHESSRSIHSLGLLAMTVVATATLAGKLVFGRAPDPQPCACGDGYCAPWENGNQGEYVNRARLAHVPVYRLRVDDKLRCVYRLTRKETTQPYALNVGDEVSVESFTDPALNRPSLIVQPDGTITLRLLGQVKAGHLTVVQLRDELEKAYTKYYKTPAMTVTPVRVNAKLEDLRATVDARAGTGGQGLDVTVTPEGTISLPAIGPVPVQGLTLDEVKREIDERYLAVVDGIEITPILDTRAPRYVYVLGEVKTPGRFTLEGPTTVTQALSLAGSWNVGANLQQVVVFRRGDDWRLMATMVDLHCALAGKNPCPTGEIWLGDSDVVLVPKSAILRADDFINLVFTRGIYGVMPFSTSYSFNSFGSIVP